MKRSALITGATSGIGLACAEKLASLGYRLILTGRREDRLQALSRELNSRYGTDVHLLTFDVRERAATEAALQGLPPAWQGIDVLVNNAGLALGRETVQDGNPDDWDQMLDTNVKGLLYVSRVVSQGMITQGRRGHIVNIGSIAGKEVYPGGAVYCGSKSAVDAISRGMRMDLLPHGIRVTAIHPGLVDTEFSIVRFKGDADKADAVYKGLEPLHGSDIAEVVAYALSVPDHVCLNDIVMTCTAQASATLTVRN